VVKLVGGAVGAAVAGPLLAGCRGIGEGESRVVVAYGTSVVQLDPHVNNLTVAESILRNMYECLIAFSPDLKSMEPQLATEWKRMDDLTMQFRLRQNVKFHNGEDFDAEAVKFSIQRMLNPATKAPLLSTYGLIDRIDVVDKYTLNVVTKSPDPILLRRMSGFHTIIVPPKYFSTASPEELATKPVGTGPYKFVSWAKDADLVMEANPNHWDGPPKIKKVVVRGIPEAGTRVSALLAGDADIIPAVPPDDIGRINSSGKARAVSIPGNRVVLYFMDVSTKPFDNKLVRQAVNYGGDIDGIIKTVLGGRGYRRATILNPWYPGYNPDIEPFPYDPEKAKTLLKKAGYPNGFDTNMNLIQGRVPKDKEVGEAIAGKLANVGIRCNIKWRDWGTHFGLASAGKLDGISFTSWGNWMHDADNSLFGQFHSSTQYAKKMMNGYRNPELDSLLEQARTTLDQTSRNKLYTEAEKILMDDCPALFGYAIEDIYGISNRVEWTPRSDEMVWHKYMSLKK
jgi:peptide/nickel transport system substrate-binding protein